MAIVKEGFLLRMADGRFLAVEVLQKSDLSLQFEYLGITHDWKSINPVTSPRISEIMADLKAKGLELPVGVAWVQFTMEVEYRAMHLEDFLPKEVQP